MCELCPTEKAIHHVGIKKKVFMKKPLKRVVTEARIRGPTRLTNRPIAKLATVYINDAATKTMAAKSKGTPSYWW